MMRKHSLSKPQFSNHLSRYRWQDWLTALLGMWLLISPLPLGYASATPQALNVHLAGALIVLLATVDLVRTSAWAVIGNLLIGLWVALSPWVGALAGGQELLISNACTGLAVLLLALWELRYDPELLRLWTEP